MFNKINCSAIILFMYLYIVFAIMKPTNQTTSNDSGNSNSVIFLILFAVSAVINILLTITIVYLVIRTRKSGYSPNKA